MKTLKPKHMPIMDMVEHSNEMWKDEVDCHRNYSRIEAFCSHPKEVVYKIKKLSTWIVEIKKDIIGNEIFMNTRNKRIYVVQIIWCFWKSTGETTIKVGVKGKYPMIKDGDTFILLGYVYDNT